MVMKPWLWPLGVSLVGGKGTGGMDNMGEAPQGLLTSVALVGTADQETTLSLDAPNLINQQVKAPFPWLPGATLMMNFLSLIC